MSEANEASTGSPADRLRECWRLNGPTDLDAFAAGIGPMEPMELAAVLRVDQSERWRRGTPVVAEDYLRRFPQLADDSEALLDLVFNEYLLAEDTGNRPEVETFVRRFPRHAETLRMQIDLHRAVGTGSQATVDHVSGQSTAHGKSQPVELPERFGRYRILRVLGRGGMGTVYLAHDSELDRQVALKVPSFPSGDTASINRFLREARVAAGFHHPNLCPVFDVGSIDGRHFLTMPVISGESLSGQLKDRGQFDPREAVRLVATIARAMAVAHAAGVIHRDLKPANIMIDSRGEPVVMDFGLARRAVGGVDGLTSTGVYVGTPAYSPPEQIASEEPLTAAADVYALGAILYQLLTGRVPFAGTASEMLRRKLTEDPAPPSRIVPGISPKLDGVCLTALARVASRRFPSMNDFAEALDACALPRPERPPSRRRTLMLVVAGLVGIVAVALGIWLGVGPQRDENPKTTGEPDLLPVGSRWVGEHSFDPDRRASWQPAGMVVTHRDGPRFVGICDTLNGDYRWEVEGTAAEGVIRWKYTRIIHEKHPTNSVQNGANAEGRFDATTIEVRYHDPGDNSRAVIRLRRDDTDRK